MLFFFFFFFFTKLDQMSRVGSRGRHPKCRPNNLAFPKVQFFHILFWPIIPWTNAMCTQTFNLAALSSNHPDLEICQMMGGRDFSLEKEKTLSDRISNPNFFPKNPLVLFFHVLFAIYMAYYFILYEEWGATSEARRLMLGCHKGFLGWNEAKYAALWFKLWFDISN